MVPEHLTSFFLRYEEPVTDDLAHICDYRETGSALRKPRARRYNLRIKDGLVWRRLFPVRRRSGGRSESTAIGPASAGTGRFP